MTDHGVGDDVMCIERIVCLSYFEFLVLCSFAWLFLSRTASVGSADNIIFKLIVLAVDHKQLNKLLPLYIVAVHSLAFC